MSDSPDALDERAAKRRREMSAALVRTPAEVDAFDREFWRQAGHGARFEAAWEMVLDRARVEGIDNEKRHFLDVAERLAQSDDPAEQEHLKDELARLTFGD